MALKLAGEESGLQEKLETITYIPGTEKTEDVEPGTKTITATAEASGLANADYSKVLTLAKPDDPRLVVLRIASRLAVTIDSMTAGHLYCRVYVDSQDADHRLFDEDWSATGDKLDAVDTHSGGLSTIFDSLKDSQAHTFYFFFWVDSGNAVISAVQLWEAVGTSHSGIGSCPVVLQLAHKGFVSFLTSLARVGTGNPVARLMTETWQWGVFASAGGTNASLSLSGHLCHNDCVNMYGTVDTDINYLPTIIMHIRSQT